MSSVGDLGRRVTERRRTLGLSRQEVAERAGMHPAYLEMLETTAAPQPTAGALWRLAAALETTQAVLCGGFMLAPPGNDGTSVQPLLETISEHECHTLISSGGIGRLVYSTDRGPVAIPVNFKMLGSDVVFRTEPTPSLAALHDGLVSFEVDRIDEALGEGWSVLLSGTLHPIDEPNELKLAKSLGITPWAGGHRDLYVRIAPNEITGRRIRSRTTPALWSEPRLSNERK